MNALEQQRADQAFGAAWRRCEAAADAPVGVFPNSDGTYVAIEYRHSESRRDSTPTAALEALAEALEARKAEG